MVVVDEFVWVFLQYCLEVVWSNLMIVDVVGMPWMNSRSAGLGSWVPHHSSGRSASRVERGDSCFGSSLVVLHWFSHCAVSVSLREYCCSLAASLGPLVLSAVVLPSSP